MWLAARVSVIRVEESLNSSRFATCVEQRAEPGGPRSLEHYSSMPGRYRTRRGRQKGERVGRALEKKGTKRSVVPVPIGHGTNARIGANKENPTYRSRTPHRDYGLTGTGALPSCRLPVAPFVATPSNTQFGETPAAPCPLSSQ